MRFKYFKDFRDFDDRMSPDGIFIENYSDLHHELGFVLDGKYNIVFPGNKHLLLAPELKDFSLKLDYEFNKLYSDRQGMLIYFRYKKLERRGLVLYVKFEKDSLDLEFGIQEKLDMRPLERRTLPKTNCCCLELDVRNNEAELRLGGQTAKFKIPSGYQSEQGLIGFDRDTFNGPLMLVNILVEAECGGPGQKTVWKEHCYEFPKVISAFDSEWKFTIGAKSTVNFSAIDLQITGGPAERESIAGFSGLMPNEELVNPYLSMRTADGEQKFYIFRGKVGLREDWNPEQPGLGRADIQCPVKRRVVLEKMPEGAGIYLGYESHWREDRIDLGTSLEMLIDPVNGRIIDTQRPVKRGAVNVELKSPGTKKTISLIGKADPRYEEAVEFAKNNHFFLESEKCEFIFELIFNRRDFSAGEFELHYRLEDAFFNPLSEEKKCAVQISQSDFDPALDRLSGGVIAFEDLKAGVYHLALTAGLFGKEFKRGSFAFEVMSECKSAQCPPEASGLPALFSHCSDNNTNSDYFDPWCGQNVNTVHYFGNCCYTSPVARKFRIWDLVHAYQRKWFLWLKPRTTKKYNVLSNTAYRYEENIEELQNADYTSLDLPDYPGFYSCTRADLLSHNTYQGVILEQLSEFVSSGNINLEHLNAGALENAEKLSAEAFDELLGDSGIWKKWLLFISKWLIYELHAKLLDRGRKINEKLQFIDYAPFPYYVATYRGGYSMLTSGVDLRNIGNELKDHIYFLEDYPFLIGYPIQRTVYTLTALKLEAPQVRLYPEIYSFCAVPRDLGVRYGSPPYGVSFPEPQTVRKRVFESVYATCFFRDNRFSYWEDYGFHLRTPTEKSMEEFLKSWGVVIKHKPLKPLRSIAFVTSVDSALKNPDMNTEKSRAYADRFMDYINTAEEFPAYIYEQSRIAGILNGFLTRPEDISCLGPDDIHTLVLPPMSVLTGEQKEAARTLNERGVNLVCSECVDGLEHVFGVRKVEPAAVEQINANENFPELSGMTENYVDPRCFSRYGCEGARQVLCGRDSKQCVLTVNRSKSAKAVLFTLPPTLIRRKKLHHKVQRGGALISGIVNRATRMMMKELDDSPVKTTQGKLIGFKDKNGNTIIIVSEDAHPSPAGAINPVVSIRGNNLNAGRITCDRDFSILDSKGGNAVIRLHLGGHESAVIKITR